MNERGHVTNAVVLGVGTGILLEPTLSTDGAVSVATVAVPVILGALVPDVDTSFGTHRKTGHNVFVLAVFVAFPYFLGNLHYVWLGIVTHYALDLLGNVRGMALFYPFSSEEYDIPVGVTVTSKWADAVTLLVTGFELAVVAGLVRLGRSDLLQGPEFTRLVEALPL